MSDRNLLYPKWDEFPNVVHLRHHRQTEHEHWNKNIETIMNKEMIVSMNTLLMENTKQRIGNVI